MRFIFIFVSRRYKVNTSLYVQHIEIQEIQDIRDTNELSCKL